MFNPIIRLRNVEILWGFFTSYFSAALYKFIYIYYTNKKERNRNDIVINDEGVEKWTKVTCVVLSMAKHYTDSGHNI